MQVERYEARHLEGVLLLCRDEGWPTFVADPDRAHRGLSAGGVITLVAVSDPAGVIGFAQALTDGATRAYLATMAVAAAHRRQGIGKALVEGVLGRLGEIPYLDLLTDTAEPFYRSFPRVRTFTGFRLHPG